MDLVPQTSWGKSLYDLLPKTLWSKIREKEINKAGEKCSICAASASKLFCHEIWDYDDNNHVQRLIGFRIVCAMCNSVMHFGRIQKLVGQGKVNTETVEKVIDHFMHVNKCSKDDFIQHKKFSFSKWRERSKHAWNISVGEYQHFINEKLNNKK